MIVFAVVIVFAVLVGDDVAVVVAVTVTGTAPATFVIMTVCIFVMQCNCHNFHSVVAVTVAW